MGVTKITLKHKMNARIDANAIPRAKMYVHWILILVLARQYKSDTITTKLRKNVRNFHTEVVVEMLIGLIAKASV